MPSQCNYDEGRVVRAVVVSFDHSLFKFTNSTMKGLKSMGFLDQYWNVSLAQYKVKGFDKIILDHESNQDVFKEAVMNIVYKYISPRLRDDERVVGVKLAPEFKGAIVEIQEVEDIEYDQHMKEIIDSYDDWSWMVFH